MGVTRLGGRLLEISHPAGQQLDPQRLAKRIEKYGNQLLTSLWYDDVPMDHTTAERAICPIVMIRKNSYRYLSDRGAFTQSILMTKFRILKLRGHQPLDTIPNALCGILTNRLNSVAACKKRVNKLNSFLFGNYDSIPCQTTKAPCYETAAASATTFPSIRML